MRQEYGGYMKMCHGGTVRTGIRRAGRKQAGIVNSERNPAGMTNGQKLVILAGAVVLAVILFLIYGLTSRNMGYFLPLRLKKLAAITLVSYSVGYSAVVFQTITGNKILTPSVMGLDSLYLFVQTVIVFFFQSKTLMVLKGNMNFLISVAVMVGLSWILYLLLFRGDQKNIYFLLLAGMVFGRLFGGMASFMQVLLDPNEFEVLQGKMFASFTSINTGLLGISAVICIICVLMTWRDNRRLDVLALGADTAVSLGVDYKRLVRKHLMIVSVLISVSTALVGPITFLGLLVVSLARQLMDTYRHSELTKGAVLLSMCFLIYGLFLVEKVFAMGTTLSVIINFTGGIYFLYYMMKQAKA